MEELMTCDVCMERFSKGAREPLSLSCGHTFCKTCLIRISKEPKFLCPSCREAQKDASVSSLAVNYKLLCAVTESSEVKQKICKDHNDDLSYWCETCQVPLCSLCIFNKHPQYHNVVKGNVTLSEKYSLLERHVNEWKKKRETDIVNKLQLILQELKTWYHSKEQFSETQKEVDVLLKGATMNLKPEVFKDVELKIKSLTLDDGAFGCKMESSGVKKGKLGSAQSLRGKERKCLSWYVLNNDGRKATLQWRGRQLLMAAFRDKWVDSDLLFKMPREVYLEFSINDECAGQVIIKPWYHLRRAQQFVAFCQGTFGVSYLGSSFKEVKFKNMPREFLVGGLYFSPDDRRPRCTDLMRELEWGGKFTGEVREGLVFGVGIEGCSLPDGESGYGICTRGQREGTFQCPFGEVLSGLDVVKMAVQHKPLTEVIITGCGLVVCDLNL